MVFERFQMGEGWLADQHADLLVHRLDAKDKDGIVEGAAKSKQKIPLNPHVFIDQADVL